MLTLPPCPVCRQPFTRNPKKATQTYCSRACFAQAQRRPLERICATCGAPFTVYQARKDARFCSWACRRAQVARVCAYCGATFYAKASHADGRVTCSRRCLMRWRAARGTAPRQGQQQSPEARAAVSAGLRAYYGDDPTKHWNWQGGHTNRRGASWAGQRDLARARDSYACACCGRTETQLGKQVSVHHRIPFRQFATATEANALDNLISTCQSCHMKLEHGKLALPATG